MNGEIEPFFRRVSFEKFEANYFWDTNFKIINLNNEKYVTTTANKFTFKIYIDDKYRIENKDDIDLEKTDSGYILTKDLVPGKNFSLIVTDKQMESIKSTMSFIGPALFWIIIGIFIQEFYNNKKNTTDRS